MILQDMIANKLVELAVLANGVATLVASGVYTGKSLELYKAQHLSHTDFLARLSDLKRKFGFTENGLSMDTDDKTALYSAEISRSQKYLKVASSNLTELRANKKQADTAMREYRKSLGGSAWRKPEDIQKEKEYDIATERRDIVIYSFQCNVTMQREYISFLRLLKQCI